MLDHTFRRVGQESFYFGSRGGGSAANIAWRFAKSSFGKSSFVGELNPGPISDYVFSDLASSGCDVRIVKRRIESRTQAIFHTICERVDGTFSHGFSLKCVCDRQRLPLIYSVPAIGPDTALLISAAIEDCDVFCVDRLVQENVELARMARACGALTAIDLGRASPLRYVSAAKLIAHLEPFDVVLMPTHVWEAIQKRLAPGLAGLSRQSSLLLQHAEGLDASVDIASALRRLGLSGLILVTGGAGKTLTVDCRPGGRVAEFPPFSGRVLETAGAGDAFLAGFLGRLVRLNSTERQSAHLLAKIIEAATSDLSETLNTIGARGALGQCPPSLSGFLSKTRTEIAESVVSSPIDCPYCGAVNRRPAVSGGKVEQQRSFQQHGQAVQSGAPTIARRVNESLDGIARVLERHEPIEKARAWIERIRGNVFVVGSGGSHSVAQYIAYTLNGGTNDCFAIPVHPLEYLRLGRKTDAVVVVSYSGKTPDCQRVILKAQEMNVPSIVLVTGVNDPPIGATLKISAGDEILSFSRPNGLIERGFVSVLGTLGPCAAWCAALVKEPLEVFELLKAYQLPIEQLRESIGAEARKLARQVLEQSDRISNGPSRKGELAISVFGSGCAGPAMIDLESKFTEGNLGWARLHDEKDFSHGRFMSVLTPEHLAEGVLIYRSDESTAYSDKLKSVLASRATGAEQSTAELHSKLRGPLGALDLLIKTQILIRELSLLLRVDISRPGKSQIPLGGLALYRWKGRV